MASYAFTHCLKEMSCRSRKHQDYEHALLGTPTPPSRRSGKVHQRQTRIFSAAAKMICPVVRWKTLYEGLSPSASCVLGEAHTSSLYSAVPTPLNTAQEYPPHLPT